MKSKYFLIIILALLFTSNYQFAQNKKAKVYKEVEVMPEFISGEDNLLPFVAQNVKYPEAAKNDGIQGKVMVEFIVDENGNVKDPVVTKGIGRGCDEEALRVTKLLKFKPGKEDGKPVNVKLTMPYMFKLDGDGKGKKEIKS